MDASTPQTAPSWFINRDFGLLWFGQAISVLGDFVFDTTLVLWIATRIAHGQSWAPLAVSGVLLAASVPMALVGAISGVFVDRWDKRRTMLGADTIRAILIFALLPLGGLLFLPIHLGSLWQLGIIYGVVALASSASEFFYPARLTLIGDLVPEAEQARAAALSQAAMPIAMIAGPPLAAPLYFAFGPAWALGINAASFVLSFGLVLAVRAPAIQAASEATLRHFGAELAAGLRFYRDNRVLMTILVVGTVTMLGFGSLNALDIFFVTQNLHASPQIYGLVGAALGAGTLLGAVLSGAFASRIGLTRVFWLSVLLTAVAILVYARMTSLLPGVAILFLAGIPVAALNTTIQPLLLLVTPRDLVGRVSSVLSPVISLATMVSMALAGYLASTALHGFHATLLGVRFGPVDTIFTAGGLLALLAAGYAWLRLRDEGREGVALAA